MKTAKMALISALAATLAACATAPGPVEVTRFYDASIADAPTTGNVFVQGGGAQGDALALAPYKNAVAAELVELGYRETARADAQYIATVRVERFSAIEGERRSPVSVGVGGSTGGFGSGVGVGIGINLGGGPKEEVGTEMSVAIAPAAGGNNIWEGRAEFLISPKSPLADTQANAATIADALFAGFPGTNGETIEVAVE